MGAETHCCPTNNYTLWVFLSAEPSRFCLPNAEQPQDQIRIHNSVTKPARGTPSSPSEGSGHGVAAIDTKVSTGDVSGRVRQQEGQGPHEVLGLSHLALGDERDPLLPEVRVVVEDLLGAARRGAE